MTQGLSPGIGRRFFSSSKHLGWLWGPSGLLFKGFHFFCPMGKWSCIILWNVVFLCYIPGLYAISDMSKLYLSSFCSSMPFLVCDFGTIFFFYNSLNFLMGRGSIGSFLSWNECLYVGANWKALSHLFVEPSLVGMLSILALLTFEL